MDVWASIILSICAASTPLLIAATGELVVERSGVLNLGVEGMMIMGAVVAFATAQVTGNPYIAAVAAVEEQQQPPEHTGCTVRNSKRNLRRLTTDIGQRQ